MLRIPRIPTRDSHDETECAVCHVEDSGMVLGGGSNRQGYTLGLRIFAGMDGS
jgi:hypothetical protein